MGFFRFTSGRLGVAETHSWAEALEAVSGLGENRIEHRFCESSRECVAGTGMEASNDPAPVVEHRDFLAVTEFRSWTLGGQPALGDRLSDHVGPRGLTEGDDDLNG